MAKFNVKTENKFAPITVEITVESEEEAKVLLDAMKNGFGNIEAHQRLYNLTDAILDTNTEEYSKFRDILRKRGVIE